mgnify:CR=1 FL=1
MSELTLNIAAVACLLLATAVLFWLTWQDYKHFLLPNVGNIALGASGIAFHIVTLFSFQPWQSLAVGAVTGALIFLISRWLGFMMGKGEAVGLGDVKFAFAAGLWLGAEGTAYMLVLASVSLIVVGGGVAVLKKKPLSNLYLPFGLAGCPVTIALIWYLYASTILGFIF